MIIDPVARKPSAPGPGYDASPRLPSLPYQARVLPWFPEEHNHGRLHRHCLSCDEPAQPPAAAAAIAPPSPLPTSAPGAPTNVNYTPVAPSANSTRTSRTQSPSATRGRTMASSSAAECPLASTGRRARDASCGLAGYASFDSRALERVRDEVPNGVHPRHRPPMGSPS